MDKLERSLSDYNKSVEKYYPIIPGEIGINLGGNRITEVPGRGQFVYVRLRSNQSEIIQVFNGKVFPGYRLPVLVKWNNNRYEIVGVDVQRYQQWLADNPHIAKHGATHSMDKDGNRIGTDPVWVYPYQFMPSLVSPFPQSGIQNVYINPLMVQYGGEWKYIGNTGTANLLTYNPTSGSSIVLISLDTLTGNPYMYSTTGTYIPSSTTGTNDLLSYLPALDLGRYIPLSFVLLSSGTTGVTWNNLTDVRQFFTPPSTGSSYLNVNGAYPISRIETDGATFVASGTTAFLEFVGGGSVSGSTGNPFVSFEIDGTLETGTSMVLPYLVSHDYNAEYAYLYLEYLGVTGTTKVDIKKNGISIFTGGYTLDIPYSLTGSWIQAVPYYDEYVTGDVFTLDILQKATGVRGLRALVVPDSTSSGGGITVETESGNLTIPNVTKLVVPDGALASMGSGEARLGLESPYALLRDQKAANSNGGTFTSGADRTRDLNTEAEDDDAIVSLSSNQFTLQAGTYRIHAEAPAYRVGTHIAFLYNVTDGAVQDDTNGNDIYGTTEFSGNSANNSNTWSRIDGKFTIAGAKAFEIRHRGSITTASNGFGEGSQSFSFPSRFTFVELRKVG